MVEADALPPLVQLLSSANIDVAEQAVWAVGNIAGDHPKMRDRVLAQNALPLLCAFLERVAAEGKISPTRNGTWALSNLVRGKPQPQLKDVAPAVPLLAKLLTLDDSEVQVMTGRIHCHRRQHHLLYHIHHLHHLLLTRHHLLDRPTPRGRSRTSRTDRTR